MKLLVFAKGTKFVDQISAALRAINYNRYELRALTGYKDEIEFYVEEADHERVTKLVRRYCQDPKDITRFTYLEVD